MNDRERMRMDEYEEMLMRLLRMNNESWGGIADYADVWEDLKTLLTKWSVI